MTYELNRDGQEFINLFVGIRYYYLMGNAIGRIGDALAPRSFNDAAMNANV